MKNHSPMLERFLRYVRIDTQSDPNSETYPSTNKQLTLLNLLCAELVEIGVSDVEIDHYGYVTGRVPSNVADVVTPVAFIAHVDTSPDVSGEEVNPQVVEYLGGDVVVNHELGLVLDATRLANYVGHTLVTTDGTTLLGADDKAGVAVIMTAVEYLTAHSEIEHGDIYVLFTPDEEVGRGVDHLDVEGFGAKYAYTVDGGGLGSLEWETFNAASAHLVFTGLNYHPGYAKGVMVNSQHVAADFLARLPAHQRPENTSDREGFYHLISTAGSVERTDLEMIVRDHDTEQFAARKEFLHRTVDDVNRDYGRELAVLTLEDQYYNMGRVIADDFCVVEIADRAMREAGVESLIEAVRGGTDGSRLSFMGLPCPNLFNGSENIHSRLEFVSEQVMGKSVEVVVNIAKLFRTKNLEK